MSSGQVVQNQDKQLNFIEIQQEELQVLESIYLHDLKILKSSPPFKFEVICKPFLSSYDDVSDAQYNLRIIIEFTKYYPEKAPIIEMEPITNISQNDIALIEQKVSKILEQINESPILYEVIETARSWIHYNLIDMVADEAAKKEEEKTKRKVYDTYTPVTEETFKIWKEKFEKEIQDKKDQENKHRQKEIDEFLKKTTGEDYFKQLQQKENQEKGDLEEVSESEDEEEEEYYRQRKEQLRKEQEEAERQNLEQQKVNQEINQDSHKQAEEEQEEEKEEEVDSDGIDWNIE
ncbi:Ubiquitin-conjugating enzyme/RWD-like protein [Pseudocohnilembus persalinus]|uniref:Ubiquitin-conjugating enzyme/RWD-like protein n=1 Tax=Pseudocohnilembus persalinus TaxID=266149 RepID=A0A0V0QMD8_PSEPJ|nr:Ubiquitin-conjugating enzyme/RWD-like protein [Pseudocohnilembus persalinus]|eukprot:KRX03292.1 Ubiquitin-conjugating enzyme/RWD-like protein [Pseudocohnilembus persalinus]